MTQEELSTEELAALKAFATLTVPIPNGWVEITEENCDGFNLHEIAYGLAYAPPEAIGAEVDWAVWMRWDGWPVVYDHENCEDSEPFCVSPPEALLRVLSEGARVILARLEQQQGQQ